jgi:hypothetical protein
MTQWEYKVVHINVESRQMPPSADPTEASRKLGGTLSPEFIAREFPEQYGTDGKLQAPARHPAEQLQHYLNLLGKEGWDLTDTAQVGPMLMFFFKRPLATAAPRSTAATHAGDEPAGSDALPSIADDSAGPVFKSPGDP